MKESEAMNKWCPHTGATCHGSDCMMWEYDYKVENGKYVRDENGHYVESDSGDCGLKTKYLECNGQ